MVFRRQQKPSAKFLLERFSKLTEARRRVVKSNESTSGISEVLTESDEFIDDFILEMDEHEEEVKREKEEQTDAEKSFIAVGEYIRDKGYEAVHALMSRVDTAL